MADARHIKLTVFSDWLCAWCYVGHKELEQAIKRCQDLPLEFDIEYRPFRLNEQLQDDLPLDREKYLSARFGAEKWAQYLTILNQRAQRLGISFTTSGSVSQTTRAHRLSYKALQSGGQVAQQGLANQLFKRYFEDGEDIGDKEMLSECAEKAGFMSKDNALDFLESDECLPEVEALIADARRKGVAGVPFVVIDGKWVVSGGQTADVYVQIFNKIATCQHYKACTSASASACPKAEMAIAAHSQADQCVPLRANDTISSCAA